ncbi:amidohydrolase family protein [Candidatus Bipolaricaulota bacterium]|jgi:imidazolonepropionase|nr:amidohydrolase family protein [Candidatus Bipolaricaulota bacterium]
MDIIISNIGQLITPVECALDKAESSYTLQITNDTELYIRNGRITGELPSQRSEHVQTIDACRGVVMPGLIDPFWVMPNVPAWIDELPESKLPRRDLLNWSLRLFQRALRSGGTTIEVKCPHDSAFEGLAALGLLRRHHHPRVIGTLLATLPEDGADRDRSMSSLIGEVIPEIRRRRLVTFCDIGWGNHAGFITEARTVLRAATGAGLRPKLHIESAPKMKDMEQLALSLEVAAIGCASHLSPDMARNLSDGHVFPVYLPTIRREGAEERIDVRALLDQGLPIAVGSGNGLAETPARSMWSVLASAMERMQLSLPEAIISCTLNNAMAMEMSHEVGSLENGKLADLILLDLVDYREIETAMSFPPVSMVMVNGEIVHSS